MSQYTDLCEYLKKIKCPICKSKLLKPKDPVLEACHFMNDDDQSIYNAEAWCAKDTAHYKMVFEWIDNEPYEMIGEDLLLWDDEYEYTIERWLINKKLNIIIKDVYGSEDERIIDIEDPGISLRKFKLQKLYTLLTFQ